MIRLQSIGMKVAIFITGLLLIVTVGFSVVLFQLNNLKNANDNLKSDDLLFNGTIKQANISFLTIDTQSNMLMGLGTKSNRLGDESLASATLNDIKTNEKILKNSLDTLKTSIKDKSQISDVNNLLSDSNKYLKLIDEAISVNDSDHAKAQRIVYVDTDKVSRDFSNNLNKLGNSISTSVNANASNVSLYLNTEFRVAWISCAVSVLLGVVIILYVAKILHPIRRITNNVKLLSDGYLSLAEMKVNSKDEIGDLATALNRLLTNLKAVVSQIALSSKQLALNSEQLTASAEQTSEASELIASEIQDVALSSENQAEHSIHATESVREISNGIDEIAHAIESIVDLSHTTNEKALQGVGMAVDAVDQIKDLKLKISATSKIIGSLDETSKSINSIIGIITGISEQTNLLALNASIEAARAGEHGRGFSVVATEVGVLAKQSKDSAKEIEELIKKVQLETLNAVNSMDEGVKSVDKGLDKVNQTGAVFKEIAKGVEQVDSDAKEIFSVIGSTSSSSKELLSMMSETLELARHTSDNTQSVASAVQEQTATMEEVYSSTEILSQMASDLQDVISKFKL